MPDVAERAGYETDAALNRAIKRTVMIGPGAWRLANMTSGHSGLAPKPQRTEIDRDGLGMARTRYFECA